MRPRFDVDRRVGRKAVRMTVAVCYKCGSMKFGAFNACPECEAVPVTEDDYAMSLAMTEHYFPKDELKKMGTLVANGEELHIDPEVRWRFIQMLKAEGVGRPTDSARPPAHLDVARLLADTRETMPRQWWRFWRR